VTSVDGVVPGLVQEGSTVTVSPASNTPFKLERNPSPCSSTRSGEPGKDSAQLQVTMFSVQPARTPLPPGESSPTVSVQVPTGLWPLNAARPSSGTSVATGTPLT